MVTNYHVVQGTVEIAVVVPNREASGRSKPKPYEARVLKTDPCYDLALLSIPLKTPEYLRFADDQDIEVGEEVRAIGNPQGLGLSVSKGIVSAVRTMKEIGFKDMVLSECAHLSGRTIEGTTWIQTDAPINPGNSGGPLLNKKNEIIGINTVIVSESGGSEGMGFALHVKHVKKFVGSYAKP